MAILTETVIRGGCLSQRCVMEIKNIVDEAREYERGRHLATLDYETGFSHAMEDCKLQSENISMILLLLVSMIAVTIILIIKPYFRTQFKLACISATMR
jgi:hypothetical protein